MAIGAPELLKPEDGEQRTRRNKTAVAMPGSGSNRTRFEFALDSNFQNIQRTHTVQHPLVPNGNGNGEPDPLALQPLIGWGSETQGAWSHPDVIAGNMLPRVYKVTTLDGGFHKGTLHWAIGYRTTIHNSSDFTDHGDGTYTFRFIEALVDNIHTYEVGDRMKSVTGDESEILVLDINPTNNYTTVQLLSGSPPNHNGQRYVRNEPRIIIFEVAGTIVVPGSTRFDCQAPYMTIMGQTAPNPGITITRVVDVRVSSAHDVIIQHIKVRPGTHNRSAPHENGGFVARTSRRVLLDHCSMSWAIDQNATITGDGIKETTGQDVTFSDCIISEGLHWSLHPKSQPDEPEPEGHSKGVLIGGRCWKFSLIRTLQAHNDSRTPFYMGGNTDCSAINNLIYNWGGRNGGSLGPRTSETVDLPSHLDFIGNVLKAGVNSDDSSDGPIRLTGFSNTTNVFIHSHDNIALKSNGDPFDLLFWNAVPAWENEPIVTPLHIKDQQSVFIMPAQEVENYMAQHVGARPWDRDAIDTRIVNQAIAGVGGNIIDHEDEVEGIPQTPDPMPEREIIVQDATNIEGWFWWDGGKNDNKNRVLVNEVTGTYAHPEDLPS